MEVIIRPLREDDAHISVKWRNMPDIWSYTAFTADKAVTLADELTWIRRVTADPTGRRFAILADGEYVGNVYLTDIHDDEAEYSIFIGNKDYWGKGIARSASVQIIDYAKNVLKLKSIRLGVNEANIAAMKLYDSLKFKQYTKDDRFTWMRLDLENWN